MLALLWAACSVTRIVLLHVREVYGLGVYADILEFCRAEIY